MFGRDFHEDIRRETQERRHRAQAELERQELFRQRLWQFLTLAVAVLVGGLLAWHMYARYAAMAYRSDLSGLKSSELQRILRGLGKSGGELRAKDRGLWDRSELEDAAQAALGEERAGKAGLAGLSRWPVVRSVRSLLLEHYWITPFALYFVVIVCIPGLLVWCCLYRSSSQEQLEAKDALYAAKAAVAFANLQPNAQCLCGSGLKFKRCCKPKRDAAEAARRE